MVTYAHNGRAIQGYQTEIDLWDIESIPSIPNRDLSKENVKAIASQLESFADIHKFPPLHVAPMGSLGAEKHEYPLINGYHRISAYRNLWYDYCDKNKLDYDNPTDQEQIPLVKIPVIVRTDIVTREDVINARYEDNVTHGYAPTSKEKRQYALFLAETYKGQLSQADIARKCGLDKSTVGKLLKRVGRPNNEDRESTQGGHSILLENNSLALLKSAERYYWKEKSLFSFFGLRADKDQEHRIKALTDCMRNSQLGQTELLRIQSIAIAMYTAAKNILPDD
jgi:hypothetical protein